MPGRTRTACSRCPGGWSSPRSRPARTRPPCPPCPRPWCRGNVNTLYAFDRASPSRLTPLTQDTTATQTDPAPSPDGSSIAYITDRDGNAEIYLMNADGSNPRRLTNTTAAENSPTWTPDGSKIVYASNAAEGTTAMFHLRS